MLYHHQPQSTLERSSIFEIEKYFRIKQNTLSCIYTFDQEVFSQSKRKMFAHRSIAGLLLLLVAAQTTSINANSQLGAWDGLLTPYGTPKVSPAYRENGDLQCGPATVYRAISNLPIIPAANAYLKTLNLQYSYLTLICVSQPQDYYIFVYTTNLGMLKINIYSKAGYTAVNSYVISDWSLKINQQYPAPF